MKKKYTAPDFECVAIDKEMSLIMMSYHDQTKPPTDPFSGGGGAPAATESDLKTNSFERSPFNDSTKK